MYYISDFCVANRNNTRLIFKSLAKHLHLLLVFMALALCWGCSSESSAPMNVLFHNTTAHYNAYFIANERIRQIEAAIWQAMERDYDKVLWVFPPLDSTMAQTYAEDVEYVLKKASIVIQYHKNSKWVDDSYILIGLARMYGYDFPNAINTFKYVNTNSEDPDARHKAVVNLMRVFIENGEYANAEAASDYLENETLNKENLKQLYLTRAYYFQVLGDMDNMVRNLVKADPLFPKKERARYYFIIGQVYQELGFASAAYEYYKKCIDSNPPYELNFYAKLNIAQVTELGDSKDLKKVRKYFKKLVNDEKNIEFKDKIYYEWGRFEFKQKNLDEAIEKFNLSVQNSLNNAKQKGLSYISLGEIYYDTLKNYQLAKSYYDSAVSVLPQTYEQYAAVKHRQEVLADFVEQYNTITLQDSLLRLATMDSATVMSLLVNKATEEIESREKAEKLAKKKEARQAARQATLDKPTGIGGTTWYFSNPSAVSSGRVQFRQTWGNRPLEDHWRRSVKQVIEAGSDESPVADEEVSGTADQQELSRDQIIMNKAREMYAAIPQTPEELAKANKLLEDAYYKLAKIYYFDLEEKDNAIATFRLLKEKYPESEYLPEAYYLLYLYYRDEAPGTADEIVALMHEKYPQSIYTKLIDNPDYEENSNQANIVLQNAYKSLYELYENGYYDSAYQQIDSLLTIYPDVTFSANLRLLQILIIGKTKELADYQMALQQFIEQYPDHSLHDYAQKLLEASKNYRNSLVKLRSARYFDTTSDKFLFVVLADSMATAQKIRQQLDQLLTTMSDSSGLQTSILELDDQVTMTVVKTFKDKDSALLFYDICKAEKLFDGNLNPYFVISKSNFDILYETKEIDAYLSFYREHF